MYLYQIAFQKGKNALLTLNLPFFQIIQGRIFFVSPHRFLTGKHMARKLFLRKYLFLQNIFLPIQFHACFSLRSQYLITYPGFVLNVTQSYSPKKWGVGTSVQMDTKSQDFKYYQFFKSKLIGSITLS